MQLTKEALSNGLGEVIRENCSDLSYNEHVEVILPLVKSLCIYLGQFELFDEAAFLREAGIRRSTTKESAERK